MRKLVKDSENNVMVLVSPNGFIPEGYTLVADEEINSEELKLARKKKMAEIRNQRDAMLLNNDKQWLIASKKAESTTSLESDAQILRDMTTDAQSDLNGATALDAIESYNAFALITLVGSYE